MPRTRGQQLEWRQRYRALKLARGCDRCGYKGHSAALHFHHKDPATKLFGAGTAVVAQWAWARIEDEIEKCELLCANCHAEIDAQYQESL